MIKTVLAAAITLALGIAVGSNWSLVEGYISGKTPVESASSTLSEAPEKPLFYRNPMNPSITSPVPAKDEMGMDYIPVYPDKPKKKAEPLFYRNPMNPTVTSPVPAQDEMGMDYIPVYAEEDQGSSQEPAGTVKIDPVIVQNIGVRTTVAKKKQLFKQIRASGRITVDESRMTRLHPRTEGWVQTQQVSRVGHTVSKGDELIQIYSPQLVTSQQEYLLALENLKALKSSPYADIQAGAKEMADSAYQRLLLLNMPKQQIRTLRRTGKIRRAVSIESPFDGIALNVGVREGQYITPKTELFMLADLSRVWLLADVYEYELPWIKVGDTASMYITGLRESRFQGKVSYIYPYAESKTRTVKVRLEFDNLEGLLKPDMFADVTIDADARPDAIVVPSESIVRSGSREQVFVVRGAGKFEPREVELGYSSEGWVEVISGIEAGEKIVSSALFLIDSESKLREATAKMMEASKGDDATSTGDKDMSMGSMSMDAMTMDSKEAELSMDEKSLDSMSMEKPRSSDGMGDSQQ
ncbi:MAG: efflux RND transporter periplasmic adaptor subunit [Motiliproteus sp.]|nr:efflux RND transporter periplasmic adaptor subunit [Motiliproteus sp.]MCW9053164.1 efflux RND transporter periplasmic adaptor subunit [Motiliproteus sp.]